MIRQPKLGMEETDGCRYNAKFIIVYL